ncbi:hypothetical protein SNEBB_009570 [Seison nebaliae]|nr:hypothetical protein SNEBB_009570 [Seison nebaliae]
MCGRRWKNIPGTNMTAYVPTIYEHWANLLTHSIVIPFVICEIIQLFQLGTTRLHWINTLIYGSALISLFCISSIFHLFSLNANSTYCPFKQCFHYLDRTMIYIFIAASYTPWLTLTNDTSSSFNISVVIIIWFGAISGTTYQYIFHEKYKWLETVLYIFVGLLPSISIINLSHINYTTGLFELSFGGLAYLVGIIFFKLDGYIPFAHAIWHLFVIIGAGTHYYGVKTHLYENFTK